MKHLKRVLLVTGVVTLSSYGISKSINNDTKLELVALNNVEALAQSESGCINRPDANDGDCTGDGTMYFCENSMMWHDCVKGVY